MKPALALARWCERVDPSRPLLDQLSAIANDCGVNVETRRGTLDDLDRLASAPSST